MTGVTTVIIVVLAVLVVVLAIALIAGRSSTSRRLPPPSEAPPGLVLEASRLVAAGKPIHAVKLVRERTGWSLSTAKAFVDRLGGDVPGDVADIIGPGPYDDAELDRGVRSMLAQRKFVHAVKLVREATGWDLATAKRYVDQRRKS